MNIRDLQTGEFSRRARAYNQTRNQSAPFQFGLPAMTRRQFLKTAGVALLGTALSSALTPASLVSAHNDHEPVHIPGGTPLLGGAYHVYGPGFPGFDPADAEPSSITDFNGFVGLAYISGEVTRTNTSTGEVRTLPFLFNDMRFMKGVFRGTDGQIHQGAFGFI